VSAPGPPIEPAEPAEPGAPARPGTPLVVTADDYGLTDATSRAIVACHAAGTVTATSVLAVAPGVERRLPWLDDAPGLSVGVHLALVGEDPPLLSATEVPTLVDRRGRLAASWRALVPRLVAGRVDPADVRRELAAQIDLVAAARTPRPTHLDSHQHLHLWPLVAEVVVALAVERGIGAVRVPRPTRPSARNRGIATLARRLDARLAAAGLARTERFRGLDEAGHWSAASLRAALAELSGSPGSVEVNVHPGPAADPDRARFAWGYDWAGELAALADPALPAAIAAHGFALVGR
jgi:predicted glycoside hydrolase/deacetylase ChbG (UPF0249 family)